LCLLITLLSWELHSRAMQVHRSDNPQSVQASVAACLYMYANLLF